MITSIEDTIDRVERLYTTITGGPPPQLEGGGVRIPPEADPVRHIEDQLGRLIAALDLKLNPAAPSWQPRAFAWRDDLALELAIDIPGVPRETLELRLDGQMLAVEGHRPPPWPAGQPWPPEAAEAPWGRFVRVFTLRERVEPSHVSARLEGGVLHVRISRSAPAEASQIPILCS
jgi:HSP20 family molecular chaperone IbpA